MRFKAKLATDQVSLLCNIITPISKLQDPHKGAVLYLDPEFVRISCKSETGITCFAELSRDIFLEHRIESAAENVIVFQIDLVSLKLALQSVVSRGGSSQSNRNGGSAHGSVIQTLITQQQVVLKLAKRNNLPCLCLDGRATEDTVDIHQAIPVRVLRATDMTSHLPPQINTPNVQLELPLERPLRVVVDKLKAISPHVYLEASMKGDLSVRLDHEGASLACFYSNLQPRWHETDQQSPPSADSSCVLKVDGAKLSQCLQWQQSYLATTSCLLGMVHNEMLVLHVLLHPEQVGFFTYYLPALFLHEDDYLPS